MVEGAGEGRGVVGEDKVEAGVLWGAEEGQCGDTQAEGPECVPCLSQSNCPWGVPHLQPDLQLDPRGGHTTQGWPLRAKALLLPAGTDLGTGQGEAAPGCCWGRSCFGHQGC